MPREPRQRDLQHDLAGALRPAIFFLRILEPLQLTTHIDKHAGELRPTSHNACCARCLAASALSLKAAALDGAARRDRSDGTSADQFEVTRCERCANQ